MMIHLVITPFNANSSVKCMSTILSKMALPPCSHLHSLPWDTSTTHPLLTSNQCYTSLLIPTHDHLTLPSTLTPHFLQTSTTPAHTQQSGPTSLSVPPPHTQIFHTTPMMFCKFCWQVPIHISKSTKNKSRIESPNETPPLPLQPPVTASLATSSKKI
jgi:hypothetical protein